MALPVEVNPIFEGNRYPIQRSLRFRSSASANLTRTPSSTTSGTKCTFSAWIKLGSLTSGTNNGTVIGAADNYYYFQYYSNTIYFGNALYAINTAAVFRDFSSWYHVFFVVDSTLATTNDRMQIWVNGVRQAVGSFNTQPGLSATVTFLNSNQLYYIGARSSGNYFDGYLAEVNFIDGYAQAATDFGYYNEFGVWSPRKYGGSYGTNGFYLPFTNFSGATSTTLGQDNSTYRMLTAQLDGSTNGLQRGADLTGNATGKAGTISMWWNFTGAASGSQVLWQSRNNSVIGNFFNVYRDLNGKIQVLAYNSVGTNILNAGTSSGVCNSAGLYHIYITWDLSVSNRFYIYVNGVDYSSIVTFTNDTIYYTAPNHGFGGNLFSPFSPTTPGMLGQAYINYSTYLDPATNLSKFYGGTATPVSLGASGQIPSGSSPIVYLDGDATSILVNRGTGGNFSAYGTLATGNTYSGTGLYFNNWTPNNISVTAGTTYDAMTDVPPPSTIQNVAAGNYCVWNPVSGTTGTLSEGNLYFYGPSAYASRMGTIALPPSGKFYFEATLTVAPYTPRGTTTGYNFIGVGLTTNFNIQVTPNGNNVNGLMIGDNGYINNFVSSISDMGTTFVVNDVIGFAIDTGANTYTIYKNNVSVASGTIGVTAGTSLSPMQISYNNSYGAPKINFGQRPFSYTPPSGYLPLNSNNLPAPTIPNGAKVMAATTYTGAGSTQAITNSGNNTLGTTFQPDFVWIKNRGAAWNNNLYDVVRGTGKALYSDLTDAENTNSIYGYLSAFSASGFSATAGTTSGNLTNQSSSTYVAWQWNAGSGTTSSGTGTGGITNVTQSVNVSAGFSIIRYTGSGTAGATFTHGLGVTPGFFIIKDRTSANDWRVWHSSFASTTQGYLTLNAVDAVATSATIWNSTAPNSSIITVGTSISVNANTDNYICYAWTPIAGYSSFGSLTSNGVAGDGAFVYLGFRPRWILLKRTNNVGDWVVIDTSRNQYNVCDTLLYPNGNYADTTLTLLDVLSNGFKIRAAVNALNNSGDTLIYAAFAENPFKLALAR